MENVYMDTLIPLKIVLQAANKAAVVFDSSARPENPFMIFADFLAKDIAEYKIELEVEEERQHHEEMNTIQGISDK